MFRNKMRADYDAFISYSHAADAIVSAGLQRALQAVGKPWYRRSRVRVFRDETSLEASPGLWSAIEAHLAQCRYFILLASEPGAASLWVRKEVQWWLSHRTAQTLFIVVTSGELAWDTHAGAFDAARTTCLPPELHSAFAEEPLHVDLRWARTRQDCTLRHARFRDATLTLAAVLHGIAKDELDSDDIRQQRRFRIAATLAVVLLSVFLTATGIGFWQAREQSQRAESNWREAQSRRLATLAIEQLDGARDIESAVQLAVLAWRLADTEQASAAMRRVEQSTSAVSRLLGQHVGRVTALAFSADGRTLATAGTEGTVLLRDAGSWEARGPALADPDRVSPTGVEIRHLVFAADGRHLLAWNHGGAVSLWNTADGTRRRIELGPAAARDGLQNAAVSASGKRVALAARGGLSLWTPESGAVVTPPTDLSHEQVYGMRFADDDQVIALIGDRHDDERIRLLQWDLSTGTVRLGSPAKRQFNRHGSGMGLEPVFSADGRRFVAWSGGQAMLWETGPDLGLRLLSQLPDAPVDENGGDVGAAFDATGVTLWVAAQTRSGTHPIWRWQRWNATGVLRRDAEGDVGGDPSVPPAWSPDGRWLVVAAAGGASAWDLMRAAAPMPAGQLPSACEAGGAACAALLCGKVSSQLDEKRLRDLFGIANFEAFYETYKSVVDASICRVR